MAPLTLTTNFAFDRIRNRFYSYHYNKLFGIDVSDPTNPIVQTVDLDGFADELSGVVLSPDGTTLYVGTKPGSDDKRSLLTILTSNLFSSVGGEVGNPMPGPLPMPNPGGPIYSTLDDFDAMPQAISSDGRWLYGVRGQYKTLSDSSFYYYLQIVTLDLQTGTIYESGHFDRRGQGRVGVDSRILALNEVKDEIYLNTEWQLVSESLLPQTIHLILNTLEATVRVS